MQGGVLQWTDFFPDTPVDLTPPAPVVEISVGLFDTADLQTLCTWTRVCSRAFTSITLTAKARVRAELIARQRRALIRSLAARAVAAAAAQAPSFQQLATALSAPGALEEWSPVDLN